MCVFVRASVAWMAGHQSPNSP